MPDFRKILAVIPCRLASTRLAQKALIPILGKPLLQHVYEGARRSLDISKLVIATDALEIKTMAESFGAEVVMTDPKHPTGSDRIWEVVEQNPEYNLIVNIQGDEPLVDEQVIEALLKPFRFEPTCVMSTLRRELTNPAEIENPNIVKVICDQKGRALYFSRSVIPYARVESQQKYYRHIGLYAYRREFLASYRNLSQTPLELTESLEQLRVLENGYRIHVEDSPVDTVDVNVAEDVLKAEKKLRLRK